MKNAVWDIRLIDRVGNTIEWSLIDNPLDMLSPTPLYVNFCCRAPRQTKFRNSQRRGGKAQCKFALSTAWFPYDDIIGRYIFYDVVWASRRMIYGDIIMYYICGVVCVWMYQHQDQKITRGLFALEVLWHTYNVKANKNIFSFKQQM